MVDCPPTEMVVGNGGDRDADSDRIDFEKPQGNAETVDRFRIQIPISNSRSRVQEPVRERRGLKRPRRLLVSRAVSRRNHLQPSFSGHQSSSGIAP